MNYKTVDIRILCSWCATTRSSNQSSLAADSKNAELGSSRSARSRSHSPYPRLSRSPIRRLRRGRSPRVRRSVFSVSPKRRPNRFGSSSPGQRRRRRRSSSSRSLPRPTTMYPYPQAQVAFNPVTAAQPPIQTQSQTPYYGLPGVVPRDTRILDSVITDFSSIVVVVSSNTVHNYQPWI